MIQLNPIHAIMFKKIYQKKSEIDREIREIICAQKKTPMRTLGWAQSTCRLLSRCQAGKDKNMSLISYLRSLATS